jgi:hypothetical protein
VLTNRGQATIFTSKHHKLSWLPIFIFSYMILYPHESQVSPPRCEVAILLVLGRMRSCCYGRLWPDGASHPIDWKSFGQGLFNYWSLLGFCHCSEMKPRRLMDLDGSWCFFWVGMTFAKKTLWVWILDFQSITFYNVKPGSEALVHWLVIWPPKKRELMGNMEPAADFRWTNINRLILNGAVRIFFSGKGPGSLCTVATK